MTLYLSKTTQWLMREDGSVVDTTTSGEPHVVIPAESVENLYALVRSQKALKEFEEKQKLHRLSLEAQMRQPRESVSWGPGVNMPKPVKLKFKFPWWC